MTQISTFFTSFAKSLTSPQYYADVLKAKISFSVKYFFLLTLLLALVTVVKVAVPLSIFNLDTILTKVVEKYPSDLVVNVKNAKVSINKPLPYAMPVPAEWRDKDSTLENAVVFDSDKNVTGVRSFYDYKTAVLVTETTIYTLQDSNSSAVKAYQIPAETKDFTINRPEINDLKNKFLNMPLIKTKGYVVLISLIILIVSVPLLFIFRMVTAFVYAVIAYVVAGIFKAQILHGTAIPLSKFWQVSMHTLTLPIVISYLLTFVFPVSPIYGFPYFLIYIVFTMYVLSQATKMTKKVTVPTKTVSKVVKAKKKTAKRVA